MRCRSGSRKWRKILLMPGRFLAGSGRRVFRARGSITARLTRLLRHGRRSSVSPMTASRAFHSGLSNGRKSRFACLSAGKSRLRSSTRLRISRVLSKLGYSSGLICGSRARTENRNFSRRLASCSLFWRRSMARKRMFSGAMKNRAVSLWQDAGHYPRSQRSSGRCARQ